MPTEVQKLILHYQDWEGAKVLSLLIKHPNTVIYASVLQNCLTLSVSPEEAANAKHHAACIQMTDDKTLRDIDARMNKLIMLKATALGQNPDTDTEAWDKELSALKKYRKDTTRPYGGIKNFNDDDRMASRRIYAAIRRLLKRAEQDGHHEGVAIVKQNLQLGKKIVWSKP